ncbi:SH3 domain-containing protein [Streptomyces sp. NPDC006984]|uniref:SH3 domain-containing protein n=1 Tax=unclassified Streptomyces TaxID=2593676 RepID=UPI0033C99C49
MIMFTAPNRRLTGRGRAARVAATALGVLALTASVPAQAAAPATAPAATPAKPYGTVTAVSGLNQRMFPSTDSAVKGTLRHGAKVGLVCTVRAQVIAGNDLWYLVRDARRVWVPARYVAATGSVKYCKDVLV